MRHGRPVCNQADAVRPSRRTAAAILLSVLSVLSVLSAAVLLMAPAAAAATKKQAQPPLQQRAPNQAELQSFEQFYEQRVALATIANHGVRPPSPLFAPAFDIERRRGSRDWSVIARVDSSPRHSGADLCLSIRRSYVYDARAAAGQRWSDAAAAPEYLVWLAQPATPCSGPVTTVRMEATLPPPDVASMLRQQAELLSRARLLFAGNTQCARQRALNFKLDAIEAGAPMAGAPLIYRMVFRSDRDSTAHVAVRKSGAEFTAWNVSCPEPK